MAIKTATTIDRFGDALVGMLQANTTIGTQVPIVFGPPPPGTLDAAKWIALLDLEFTQTPRAMDVTNRPRHEQYQQEFLISVVRQTRAKQSIVDAEALELLVACSDAIRDNPAMTGYFTGDGQIRSLQLQGGVLSRRADDRQRECSILGRFEVKAAI